MKIESLVALLVDAGVGTLGQDIFIYAMPDVLEGVLFKMPLAGIKIDHELKGYFKHPFQVIVRGREMQPTLAKADLVVEALVTDQLRELPGMHVNYLRQTSLPIVYPRTVGNSLEVSINFDCSYVLT